MSQRMRSQRQAILIARLDNLGERPHPVLRSRNIALMLGLHTAVAPAALEAVYDGAGNLAARGTVFSLDGDHAADR